MFQNDVNRLLVLAENIYKRKFKPIKVGKPITGLTAGYALPCGTVVQFNEEAAKSYPDIFWKTVVHEVAHAVDIQLHGHRRDRRGRYIHHDNIFYEICKKLGDPTPNTTHEYDLKPSRKYREFKYSCGCTEGTIVKTPTHNKIQKQYRVYRCLTCGDDISHHNFIQEIKT